MKKLKHGEVKSLKQGTLVCLGCRSKLLEIVCTRDSVHCVHTVNSRNLFLMVSGDWKSKIKPSAGLDSGNKNLLDLKTATFSSY